MYSAITPAYLDELKATKAEFEHRLRQLNDIVERNGGAFGPVAAELRQVRENLNDVEKEIARAIAP